MKRRLPPDRDPLLRQALSLVPAEQARELATMFGETQPAQRRRSGPTGKAFVHYGAAVAPSPKGGLAVRPIDIPLPIIDTHARAVTVAVDHWAFCRNRTPRAHSRHANLATLTT